MADEVEIKSVCLFAIRRLSFREVLVDDIAQLFGSERFCEVIFGSEREGLETICRGRFG